MAVGIDFWMYFASNLSGQYALLQTVTRDDSVHKLQRVWNVADKLRLHLKSDQTAADVEQPMLPGIETQLEGGSLEQVVLTWSHNGVARSNPAFVHMLKSGKSVRQAWRISVADLLHAEVTTVATPARRSRVSSKRQDIAAQDTTGTDGA